jgi:PAS domain S-box-containing protein
MEQRVKALEQEAGRRRHAEEALRASEQRLKEFVELLPENVSETDALGNIVFVNRKAFDVFGYTQEDLEKGLTALQMLAPEDRDRAAENMGKVLSGWDLGGIEYTAQRKDGSTFPALIYANPVVHDGGPAGLRAIIVDITDRKRAMEALRESEVRYRTLFQTSTDGIATASMNGAIQETNPAFQRMLGYEEEELRDKPIQDITPEKWHDLEAEAIQGLLEEAGSGHGELEKEYIRKDGTTICVSVSGTLVRDKNGNPEKLVAFVRDITERKRAEQELRTYQELLEERVEERTVELKQEIVERKAAEEKFKRLSEELEERVRRRTAELEEAYQELKKLDEMKDAFLSSVSHELRTPLTSIRSFSQILLRYQPDDPATQREFIDIINAESERLTRLINDLLHLARIEAGEMVWNDNLISLEELVKDVAKTQHQLLKAKSIRLTLDVPSALPPVFADRDRIQQVFTNLLANAIKFSLEGGEIYIHGERINDTRSDGDPEWLRMSLSDQGVGIDEENLEAIFDRFRQVSRDSLREKPRGTGLGLPISREIITHYGGQVWVESEKGKGSTFFITVPVAAASDRPTLPTSVAPDKLPA